MARSEFLDAPDDYVMGSMTKVTDGARSGSVKLEQRSPENLDFGNGTSGRLIDYCLSLPLQSLHTRFYGVLCSANAIRYVVDAFGLDSRDAVHVLDKDLSPSPSVSQPNSKHSAQLTGASLYPEEDFNEVADGFYYGFVEVEDSILQTVVVRVETPGLSRIREQRRQVFELTKDVFSVFDTPLPCLWICRQRPLASLWSAELISGCTWKRMMRP